MAFSFCSNLVNLKPRKHFLIVLVTTVTFNNGTDMPEEAVTIQIPLQSNLLLYSLSYQEHMFDNAGQKNQRECP